MKRSNSLGQTAREYFKFLFAFIFILFFIFPVVAIASEVTIEGDVVEYQDNGKQVKAYGKVKVYYKDLDLSAGELTYYSDEKRVVATKGFNFVREEVLIDGESLDYGLETRLGKGVEVNTVYADQIFLYGKRVSIYPDKIELNNASFNGCGATPPHYKITASDIILYPDVGWVVAYWGLFWYNSVPLMPVPTYLFDARAEQRRTKNEPPFPEIGENDEDGSFINQRFVWHGSEKWHGRFTLSHFSKKGWGGGVEGNYVLDSANEGNLRFFLNPVDQWSGGLTHFYSFGDALGAQKVDLNSLLPWFSDSRYMLETNLTYNERINYERISFLPSLTLFARSAPVGIYKLQNQWSLGLARITEKSSALDLNRLRGKLEYFWEEPLWVKSKIVPYLWLDYSLYSGNNKWLQTMGRLSFVQGLDLFGHPDIGEMGLHYTHYFGVDGRSPFAYENYLYQDRDEFASELFIDLGTSKLGVRTSHYVSDGAPKDIDYIASARWHCYGIILTYRTLRREINFAFSLEPPR